MANNTISQVTVNGTTYDLLDANTLSAVSDLEQKVTALESSMAEVYIDAWGASTVTYKYGYTARGGYYARNANLNLVQISLGIDAASSLSVDTEYEVATLLRKDMKPIITAYSAVVSNGIQFTIEANGVIKVVPLVKSTNVVWIRGTYLTQAHS